MANLDSIYIDPATVSPRPTGMRWGFILGCISAVLAIVEQMTGMVDYTGTKSNFLPSLLTWLVVAVCCYMAVKQHRDTELGGYISISRSLGVTFWIGLIAGIISAIAAFIMIKFMMPDMKEKILDAVTTQMENKGQDPEQAKKGVEMMSWMFNPAMIAVFALLGTLFYTLIFGLISALILKKDPPSAF